MIAKQITFNVANLRIHTSILQEPFVLLLDNVQCQVLHSISLHGHTIYPLRQIEPTSGIGIFMRHQLFLCGTWKAQQTRESAS